MAGYGPDYGAKDFVSHTVSRASAVGKPATGHEILNEMEKRLDAFAGQAERLHAFTDRLIGTRPEDASKNPSEPPSNSIEGRLHAIIRRADEIIARSESTFTRLETFT